MSSVYLDLEHIDLLKKYIWSVGLISSATTSYFNYK